MSNTATTSVYKHINQQGLILYKKALSHSYYNSPSPPWPPFKFYSTIIHDGSPAHIFNRRRRCRHEAMSLLISSSSSHKRSQCFSSSNSSSRSSSSSSSTDTIAKDQDLIKQQQRHLHNDLNMSSSSSIPPPSLSHPPRGDHKPPLPVRVALVSCSTALCTPIFPAIGFIHLCLRILRTSNAHNGQNKYHYYPFQDHSKLTTASLGTICNVAFYYILPISYELSPILLPCAIGNGLVAGTSYWALDVLSRSRFLTQNSTWTSTSTWTSNGLLDSGPARLLKNPLMVGGGIGAWTGLVAPPLMYGPLCHVLYGVEGISNVVTNMYWNVPLVPQISCMTGFVAGVFMYPFLYYPMHGIEGVSWKKFSGVVLLGTGLTLYHVYTGGGGGGGGKRGEQEEEYGLMGISNGAFVPKSNVSLLSTIVRYNNMESVAVDSSGGSKCTWGAYSLQNQQWVGGPELKEKGQIMADTVRKYQSPGWWWMGGKRTECYTFDDPVLAFYCEWLDENLGERYPDHVVHVRQASELQTIEQNMLQTDWVVRCVVENGQNFNGEDGGDGIRSKYETIEEELRKGSLLLNMRSDRQIRKFVQSVSTSSNIVEMIMTIVKQKQDVISQEENVTTSLVSTHSDIDAIIEDMETMVRKSTPGIVLYKREETDGLIGQSVESQLEAMSWEPLPFEICVKRWQDLKSREKKRITAKKILLVGVCSCAAALVAVIFKK